MSELPEGWTDCKLQDCAKVLDNLRVPVNSDERNMRQGSIPYYGATGQVGWIDDCLFDEELLLIGEDGAPFFDKTKPIAYIIRGKSWVNNHAHVLRAISGLTSNLYLKYFLDQFDFHEYVNGTTRLKLTQGSMNEIPVKLAAFDEQRRIVSRLEKLLSRVDAAQARLATIPLILKRFRQSVLAAACSGRLTADWRTQQNGNKETFGGTLVEIEIPDSWVWKKLPELGFLARGKSKHRPRDAAQLYGGDYPFIQTGNIARSNGFITEHNQTYNEVGLAQSKRWEAGTVCITIAANIADSAILTYPACFPDSVVGFIAHGDVCLPKYVEFFIRTARSDLSQFAPATAQKNINLSILNEVLVPLPPLAEQREIVRRVEALFKSADALEARYRTAKAHVDKLTQSILARAFRGELVPQDPDDEPASVLLERIRQSKGVATVKKRSARR